MKIPVTGGARCMGSHLATRLVEKPDAEFHLAALPGVTKVMDNAAMDRGSKEILASTSEIYAKNTEFPFRAGASSRVRGWRKTA